jgi:hypothetical protein
MEYGGEPWLRYTFTNGQKAAIELSKVGILTEHRTRRCFRHRKAALNPTMKLMDSRKQGMEEAIKHLP